jgi:hypothetical protein
LGAKEALGDRAEHERRQVLQRCDDRNDAEQKDQKVASLVGTVPADGLAFFFAASEPAIARIGRA